MNGRDQSGGVCQQPCRSAAGLAVLDDMSHSDDEVQPVINEDERDGRFYLQVRCGVVTDSDID